MPSTKEEKKDVVPEPEFATYESPEALLEAVKATIVEQDGKFAVKESVDLATMLAKKTDDNRKGIQRNEALEERARKAEEAARQHEAEKKRQAEEIEGLKKPGEHEEKLQEINRKLTEANAKIRKYEEDLENVAGLEKKALEYEEKFNLLHGEVNNTKILNALRSAALGQKVPASFIESDDFKNNTAFLEIAPDGDVVTKDGRSLASFIRSRQSQYPHWNSTSNGAGASPGKALSPADSTKAAYDKAKATNNFSDMCANAPVLDSEPKE